MRRVIALFLCILLLAVPAHGANAAQSLSSNAHITANGSCQITITADIRLEEPVKGLRFPVAAGARSVTCNGRRARVSEHEGIHSIQLKQLDGLVGLYSCTVSYELNTVLSLNEKGEPMVTVPLLSGFPYCVEAMSFAVSLPSELTVTPTFYSGYHGKDIELQMDALTAGSQIQGTLSQSLKDNETLFLQFEGTPEMFPPSRSFGGSMTFDAIAMAICAGAAFLFWLLTMRTMPRFGRRRATAPEGICAGQMGMYLVHRGADLPIMILQWAQLGYLSIQTGRGGKVFLRKKMEMGNERSAFEQRCFQSLFHDRTTQEATGRRFHGICDRVSAYSLQHFRDYRSAPGMDRIFRLLASLVGLFAGIAMGDSFSTHHTWRYVLMLLLGAAGYAGSWYLQEGMDCLHLRGKAGLKFSLLLSLGFVLGSIFCGCPLYGIAAALWSLFAGLCGAYGGIRSENSKRLYGDIMSLRKHLRKADREELRRIITTNPNYYYELAPYALALDVDKVFASHMGDTKLPLCTWLDTGTEIRTASGCAEQLRKVVDAMIADREPTPAERMFGK